MGLLVRLELDQKRISLGFYIYSLSLEVEVVNIKVSEAQGTV